MNETQWQREETARLVAQADHCGRDNGVTLGERMVAAAAERWAEEQRQRSAAQKAAFLRQFGPDELTLAEELGEKFLRDDLECR